MIRELAALPLAPWLVAQGRRVRAQTPRLPEPPGARHGRLGEGPRLRLLILGDSAAAGVGAPSQAQALSGHLVRALLPHHAIEWHLLARTGDTAADVLQHLRAEARGPYDVALTSIGVNDVTGRTGRRAWKRTHRAILDHLQQALGLRLILMSPVPPMHAFPALPQPLRWYLGQRARALVAIQRELTRTDGTCALVPLDLPPEPHFFASDGFHPSPAAYAVWAEAAARQIRAHVAGWATNEP